MYFFLNFPLRTLIFRETKTRGRKKISICATTTILRTILFPTDSDLSAFLITKLLCNQMKTKRNGQRYLCLMYYYFLLLFTTSTILRIKDDKYTFLILRSSIFGRISPCFFGSFEPRLSSGPGNKKVTNYILCLQLLMLQIRVLISFYVLRSYYD